MLSAPETIDWRHDETAYYFYHVFMAATYHHGGNSSPHLLKLLLSYKIQAEVIASEAKRRKARRVEGASEESSFYGHIWDLKTRR